MILGLFLRCRATDVPDTSLFSARKGKHATIDVQNGPMLFFLF